MRGFSCTDFSTGAAPLCKKEGGCRLGCLSGLNADLVDNLGSVSCRSPAVLG
jgi:hypothetical protein